MDSKELRLFREAYSSIHTPQTEEIQEETVAEEQLDEGLGEKAAELLDKGTKKIQGGLEKMGVPINRTKRGTVTKADQEKRIQQNNSADLFDIVKGHLVSEGLTEEEAIQKMVTMTEEERNAIVEQYTVNVADVKGGTEAAKRAQSGATNVKTGKPLYKPGPGVGPDFKLLKGV